MKEEKPFNIFDAAGSQKKSPPKKKPPKEEPPPAPVTPPPPPQPLPSDLPTGSVDEMLKTMEQMRDDLNAKFEEVCFKGGINPKHLEKFTELLSNTDAWKKMDKEREELEKKVKAAVGTIAKIPSKEKRAAAKMDKERKGKTLGTRKKWIPMH